MTRGSDPVKVAAWRERFARFEVSGMTSADFCAAEKVTRPSFYAWRRKLGLNQFRKTKLRQTRPRRTKPRQNKTRPGAFEPVMVRPMPALAARLPGGVVIEVSAGNEAALRTIVGELVRASSECEGRECETRPC